MTRANAAASPQEPLVTTLLQSILRHSSSTLDIVFVTTEAVPFAKTGGLADVSGTLPVQLARRGHRVAVIMPAFRHIRGTGNEIEHTDISFAIPINDKLVGGRLLKSKLPFSDVPVYFVDQPAYFDRPELYGDSKGDYVDNCERFSFFCRAVLQAITRLGRSVDLVHCNDWQTGLVPAYMATGFESHPWSERAASVMTIHNMAYQGMFWKFDLHLTGLGWEHFTPEGLEYYGQLNFLKAGIVYADAVSTVSPRYATEIQTTEHGCGLEGTLRAKSDTLVGITNGIDPEVWSPSRDSHLSTQYDVNDWREGKLANRRAIRQHFGLDLDTDAPLIGLVGRLADQKGWDLVFEVMQRFLEDDRQVQWVVLGTGDPRYHDRLESLSDRFPSRLGVHLGFSDHLAHRIEAAADIFLMPSRYEPCGLNQLYSLRYGTVPVVNPTGGLADTVTHASRETYENGTATGFHMQRFSAGGLEETLLVAVDTYKHFPERWAQLVETGMRQDWTWGRSAVQYEALYAETISRKRSAAPEASR